MPRFRFSAAALALLLHAHAHVVLPPALTRARCYHDGATTDLPYRGAPCGRASRGIQGVLVAGARACLPLDMVVPHAGALRMAIAAGTAPAGPTLVGTPTDSWEVSFSQGSLAEWPCSALPSCPGSSRTGRFRLPITLPQDLLTTAVARGGVLTANNSVIATLQARQSAPEYNWYYYDCADILLVNRTSDIPPSLVQAWRDIEGPCPAGLAFEERAYPFTWYIERSIVLGAIFLCAVLLVLGASLVWCIRARKGQAAAAALQQQKGPLTSADPAIERAESAQNSRDVRASCMECCREARRRWRQGLALVLATSLAMAIAGGVLTMMPTCEYRPSPGFGP